ncbi:MAG: hypothetical protein EBU90_30890 [Proteobacteria bacterium]|nr:hypothetical protein [Pseudomonadota bacterium]
MTVKHSIEISKSELHLAAYIKAGGADFLNFNDGFFVFSSDKSELEWRVLHSNSESLKVDRELFTLKKFFK